MGIGCYCMNKKAEAQNEGGSREDKNLFKRIIDAETGERPILDQLLPASTSLEWPNIDSVL